MATEWLGDSLYLSMGCLSLIGGKGNWIAGLNGRYSALSRLFIDERTKLYSICRYCSGWGPPLYKGYNLEVSLKSVWVSGEGKYMGDAIL